MLLVPTYVAASPIAGFGLYAAEPIPAGTVWWKYVEGFDKLLTPAEVEALPPLAKAHVTTYAYLWKGRWIHCADHAIFTNHSDTPNSYGMYPNADAFGWSVASRDIARGEEITEDYRTFCDDWQSYPFLVPLANGSAAMSLGAA
jgi:SET domain-containing protein